MQRDNAEMFEVVFALLIIIILGILMLISSVTITSKTITIQEKIPTTPYKIVDMEDNVYIISDNWLVGKVDASNRYAKIKLNETYNINVTGMRFPPLSFFPNIIEITKV